MSNETKEGMKWIFGLIASIFLFISATLINDMREKVNKTYDFVIQHEEQLKRVHEDVGETKKDLRELKFEIQTQKYYKR